MLKNTYHKNNLMVIAIVMTIFFSCQDNFKDIQKIGMPQTQPISEAENINLKYTIKSADTSTIAIVKANLISPKMLDFSNREFGYQEFPEGIHLIIYDDEGKQSDIFSDYATIYTETDLLDLRKNVIIVTNAKDTLFADQLYYDQEKEWLFTNESVKFKTKNQIIEGNSYSSDSKFKTGGVTEVTGIVFIDEN
jgi:LPS export ABC transporter protein LptC